MRLILLLPLLMVAPTLASDPPEVGDEASVQVSSQQLFPRPVFYAQPITELSFGEVVDVLDQDGDWYRVSTASGETGWVHSTSLTGAVAGEGDIGSGSGEVSSDEVMLAGRGFNSDVEEAYSSDHPDLDFEKVDEMEAMEVSPQELYEFLVEGMLIEADEDPVQEQGSSSGQGGGRRR